MFISKFLLETCNFLVGINIYKKVDYKLWSLYLFPTCFHQLKHILMIKPHGNIILEKYMYYILV